MLVVGRRLLQDFGKRYPDAAQPLKDWYTIVSALTIKTPMQWRNHIPKVSIIGAGCTVFNIKGNYYRLSATVDYQRQIIRVWRVMTHEEYDAVSQEDRLCSDLRNRN